MEFSPLSAQLSPGSLDSVRNSSLIHYSTYSNIPAWTALEPRVLPEKIINLFD
jgi:hypothetical protein